MYFRSFFRVIGLVFCGFIKTFASCLPDRAVVCYPDSCNPCYCLGPENPIVNAPVRPYTCYGDIVLTTAGIYWKTQQDGLEYALSNQIFLDQNLVESEGKELIHAKYKTPEFKWNPGFKMGLGFNNSCDGWDIGMLWTYYKGRAFSHDEAPENENSILVAIWSAFQGSPASIVPHFARKIDIFWKPEFNLIELDLGREYWTSKFLSFRPFIGIYIVWINQKFELEHKGGYWNEFESGLTEEVHQEPFENVNSYIKMTNDFHGVGPRSGFDLRWHLECGWSLFSHIAASILYGKFHIKHHEYNQAAESPFEKFEVLKTDESFRVARAALDFSFGLEWAALLCECKYLFRANLSWEQHLFLHQNQLWRVNRIGGIFSSDTPNNSGENGYFPRRGTLSTQGWTLQIEFAF